MKQYKIAIGIDDYKKLIDGDFFYIDKTEFISEFLNNKGEVTLITRPRRFGKTLNLSTVAYFLDIKSKNNEYLFSNKKIWKYTNLVEQHFAKYPVVFLSLKNCRGKNTKAIKTQIRSLIAHYFLNEIEFINSFNDQLIIDYFKCFADENNINANWEMSLNRLTELLYIKYKSPAVVIVDEYDTPVHESLFGDFYDEIVPFISMLLGAALKNNKYLAFSLVSGILHVSKENFFSGLNNLHTNTVLNNHYADKFGFTEEEINALEIPEDKQSLLKKWYNGYHFGNAKIYNPWSIINFLIHDNSTDLYWINTSSNLILLELIKRLSFDVTQFFEQEETKIEFNNAVTLKNIYKSSLNINSLMIHSGYLTISKKLNNEYYAKIPNYEVKKIIEDMSKELLMEGSSSESNFVNELKITVETGDAQDFQDKINKFLIESLSYNDFQKHDLERSYHLFILGILVILKNDYYIKSNQESGYGRYDIAIIPKDISRFALLIEFKKASDFEDLSKSASIALKQIQDKKYKSELLEMGYKKIHYFGIGCFKKHVLVKSLNT